MKSKILLFPFILLLFFFGTFGHHYQSCLSPGSIFRDKPGYTDKGFNLVNPEVRAPAVSYQLLKRLGPEKKTGRNWIWDTVTPDMRRVILERLSNIDTRGLYLLVKQALFRLSQKLPMGQSVGISHVSRIMIKGSYLYNPLTDVAPTDIDLIVILDTEMMPESIPINNFSIPQEIVFLHGARGEKVKKVDINFVPDKNIREDSLTLNRMRRDYALIWGSTVEVFTKEGYREEDIRPSDFVLLIESLQLIENAYDWLTSPRYLDGEERSVRFGKVMKRVIEANCILAYLGIEVEFNQADYDALAGMLRNYLNRQDLWDVPVYLREEYREETIRQFQAEAGNQLIKSLKKNWILIQQEKNESQKEYLISYFYALTQKIISCELFPGLGKQIGDELKEASPPSTYVLFPSIRSSDIFLTAA